MWKLLKDLWQASQKFWIIRSELRVRKEFSCNLEENLQLKTIMLRYLILAENLDN